MHTNITIIHIVNNYSGAARYSLELQSQKNYFRTVYISVVYRDIDEISIETHDNSFMVNFPVVKFCSSFEQKDFFEHIIKIISVYISLENRIIIHDNGANILFRDFIDNHKEYKYIHTLHFIPTTTGVITHPPLEKFDRLILVTRYAQDYINSCFSKSNYLIYNGVRENKSVRSNNSTRAKFAFGETEFLILYVGRIEDSKGVDILVNVFSNMVLDNARLVVVGSGAYDLVLEKIEANHSKVTFLGNIDNAEVHNLMVACDIGVIPSLNEQCSYVALEMMSHGMAIIASEVKGMEELFVGKDIALTIPVDYTTNIPKLDTDVLKQHIITLAADSGLRKYFGERARREWAEHYTAERMARETQEVYHELAAQF